MKIYVFEVEAWEQASLQALGEEHELVFATERLTAKNAEAYADAEAVSTFIYSRIDERALDALPALKLIASRSTGVDHIDTAACGRRGVAVCNVPTYGTNTVAEHVFGLLLMISHRLEEAVDRTRKGEFSARGLQGFDLFGKTLGIIGTGDIGMATIRIANGFCMRVLAYDIAPDHEAARKLGFGYVELDALLQESDIVSLHIPATPATRHFLSRDQFTRMKDGAILINTARGDVVDVRALARALVEGKIAAAGLDVLPEEPTIREELEVLRSVYEREHDLATLLADQILVRMKNVVVTPHSAFYTREAIQRILDTTVANIRAFAGGKIQNAVPQK